MSQSAIYMCVCLCVSACMRIRAHACTCACMCACMSACMHACLTLLKQLCLCDTANSTGFMYLCVSLSATKWLYMDLMQYKSSRTPLWLYVSVCVTVSNKMAIYGPDAVQKFQNTALALCICVCHCQQQNGYIWT